MNKMVIEDEFRNIIGYKVDINLKIAKIISNELNWKIEYNHSKSERLCLVLPL